MEKLTIKNFGPIKDIDIELKRVNIFIGPQGSGKSTIAKIISSVRNYEGSALAYDSIGRELKASLEEDFNLTSYFEKDTKLIIETTKGDKIYLDNSAQDFTLAEPQSPYFSKSIYYIPTERTIVPLIAEASFLFLRERPLIPRYITDFGILFQQARSEVKSTRFSFLGDVMYSFENNTDKIVLKSGKKIKLSESSNGIQTTMPLLLAISLITSGSYKKSINRDTTISIEEPELSLFPLAQYDLLKFIIEKASSLKRYCLNITTHSPYTLTAINNLIYAYQVGKNNSAVQSIIPENLWLNPDDVGAWFIEGGTARSIIDEETKQIKAEEIDKVSEVLNGEYDKIMNIKLRKGE